MYKIKYNDAVICTPQFKEFAAIAGTLQEELNAVSVFSFTLPPNHLYFDSIEGRNGLVKLYDDDNVLFIGDIVNRKESFDCTAEIECQDALGWLNDVVFVKPAFSGEIENYWAFLLGRYNSEASEWRKINIGTVTVQGNISINHDTEFLTIFDLVSELTKLSGGNVSVRYEGEEIFLDYLAQANTESDQSILFGTNLINLEDFVSEEQIFSRIYPRGKDGLDISSVNGGLTYLTNGITESMFGIVAVTVDFDTESATELKALGQAYLEANGLASRTLTLTAFDLSLIDKKYTEIKVGNIIPVISPLHGINAKMQVNAKTTDIVTPENSIFTLGLILNTISGIMASGGTSSKTISGHVTPPGEITGAVRYDISQTLIDSEKTRARANIGAGTSNFDGRYSSLSGKPTIPTKTSDLINDSGFGTVKNVNGVLPDDAGAITLTPADINAASADHAHDYVLLVDAPESTDSDISLTPEQVAALQAAAQNNLPITLILRDGEYYTAFYPFLVESTSMLFGSVCNFNSLDGSVDVNQALGRMVVASVDITEGAGTVRFIDYKSGLTRFLPLSLSIRWTEEADFYTLTDEQYAILRQSLLDKRPIFIVRNTADMGGKQTLYMLQTCDTPSIYNVDSMELVLRGLNNSIKVQMADKTIVPNADVPSSTTYIAVDSTDDAIFTVNGETYADIQALINDSKPVIVRWDVLGDFYYFDTFGFSDSSGIHRRLNFRCVMGDIVYTLTLKDDNTWFVSMDSLQSKSITDSGGYYTTDTVDGALQEIGAELEGINALLGSGGISVEDDGAGNVEITAVPSGWTVTDDGNGNVVIGG